MEAPHIHSLCNKLAAHWNNDEENEEETPQWVLLLNEEEKKKLAESYKAKGNLAMKFKDYKKALQFYTRAIQAGCSDDHLMAALHNNRSAAKFYLKDYQRALMDAERALAINGDYLKPRWRAANCAYQLKQYKRAEKFCTETIAHIKDEADAPQLLIRDEATKLYIEIKKELENSQRLLDVVKNRRIKFSALSDGDPITEETLCPKACMAHHSVRFSPSNPELLEWTAFIIGDKIRPAFVSMPEDAILDDVLSNCLPKMLPFDCPRRDEFCRSHNLDVYAVSIGVNRSDHKINHKLTIQKILEDKNVYIHLGVIFMKLVCRG